MNLNLSNRILLLATLLVCNIARAQSGKSIFLELGGSGGLGSVNYEHWFPVHVRNHTGWDGDDGVSKFQYTFRVGLGASPIDQNNGWVVVIPAMINCIYGKHTKAHRIELGAGLAPSFTTKGSGYIKSPFIIGYRFMPEDKRIFVRAGYTPIFGWLVDYQWQHWAGISVGYKLGGENEK